MNTFRQGSLLPISFLLASVALIGCGGATNFPDSVASSAAAGPPISATVYGGHAPIVGAHVYLLQPSTTAYGGVATSLLGNNGAISDSSGVYTLTANINDPHVPTTSPVPEYETTDSNGNVNLTGAYKCTVGQPVYMYAFGGNVGPTSTSSITTFTISQIVVSGATTGTGGTATYTVTISTAATLTVGQSVTVARLTNKRNERFDDINGAQTVTAAAPNSTTFSFVASDDNGNVGNGDGTYTSDDFGKNGTVTATTSTTNPAEQNTSVVQLATLGNCPGSGNFTTGAGALSNVFMNEVSTVATAYTFQPFTLATNNDAWHIGTSGSTQAQLGIANAADTAAQLYNIQGGGPASTTADGDGHLANTTTPNGNGTVPQAEIDTLADIIASCVDSTPVSVNTPSSQCSAIFSIATDNGETGGTQPTDTGTAVINIARYPDGNHSAGNGKVDTTYASDLFDIPSGTVPYTPELTAAPNDWTLSISYTGGGIGATAGQDPHDVAVDASGNIYTTNFTGNALVIFSPLGVPASTGGFGTALDGPGSVAIDSTSSNVWLVNFNNKNVSRFTLANNSGTETATGETEFATGETGLQDAELDGSGNVWVTSDNASALIELNSSGTVQNTITNNIVTPFGVAIQPGMAGNIWVADQGENDASAVTSTGGTVAGSPFNGDAHGRNADIEEPIGAAIDSAGNIWFANHNGSVSALTSTGGNFPGSPFSTGDTNYNDSLAIDGSNNIWVTNPLNRTVYVLNDTGDEITPAAGYVANPTTDPDGIAIDPSGNVWYDSFTAGVLYELVGAASPTVTPLSLAVSSNKLGAKP